MTTTRDNHFINFRCNIILHFNIFSGNPLIHLFEPRQLPFGVSSVFCLIKSTTVAKSTGRQNDQIILCNQQCQGFQIAAIDTDLFLQPNHFLACRPLDGWSFDTIPDLSISNKMFSTLWGRVDCFVVWMSCMVSPTINNFSSHQPPRLFCPLNCSIPHHGFGQILVKSQSIFWYRAFDFSFISSSTSGKVSIPCVKARM